MTSSILGIIGSVEVAGETFLDDSVERVIETTHGAVPVVEGTVLGRPSVLISRSGGRHPLAPHEINFRANIEALSVLGVREIIGTGMVGGLTASLSIGTLVLPEQFIDFTKHRDFTYYAGGSFGFVDFTNPFCPRLLESALGSPAALSTPVVRGGCYVCVDGPRFETAAEVQMFAQMGGSVIGMTIVPECVMAREAGMCYAALTGVVNLAAGLGKSELLAGDFLKAREGLAASMRSVIANIATEGDAVDPECICRELARLE